MEIIALQEYTDKYISLYEGEIRNIQNVLANKLIEQGIVAEHNESSSGGGEGGNSSFIFYPVLVSGEIVTNTDIIIENPNTIEGISASYNELKAIAKAGKTPYLYMNGLLSQGYFEQIASLVFLNFESQDYPLYKASFYIASFGTSLEFMQLNPNDWLVVQSSLDIGSATGR